MAPKRMTANPIKPARYRPGKAVAEVSSSESDSEEEQQQAKEAAPSKRPPPSASSFPKSATQISTNLKNVDLNAQQRAQAARKPVINEDEFETEEESGAEGNEGSESGSGSEEEESSEEEDEESSEDDAATRRKLLRPVFVKKDARKLNGGPDKTEDERWKEEERRKKERSDALIQEELEKQAAAKAAGKKYWDDEDNIVDEVDDTDDLDPEAERAAWKLREFTRVKRDRDALIAAEKEHEEVERRRNLSKEERDAEDKIYLDKQKEEKDGKGQMGFMQKYYHKGAFFTEDLEKGGLANRDIMGGRYEDDVSMRDALPAYMQIRDMTKLGKKGHTKYKDMKSEDTGRWGDFLDNRKPRGDDGDWSRDERFRRDYDGGDRTGPSGANASSLGERKRPPPGEDRRDDKRARVD